MSRAAGFHPTGHRRFAGGRLVTLVLAALLGPVACTSAPVEEPAALASDRVAATADAEPTTSLRWALPEPSGITPATAVDEAGLRIVDLLFDSLTVAHPDGAAAPALAVDWHSQDNARRWIFTLSPDARFHDGTPVTAADVVRGWEAVVRAGLPQLAAVEGFDALRSGTVTRLPGVRAVDERTLRVELTRPDTAFPVVASHPSLAPQPAAAADEGYADRPVGNGPFAMAEPWARGRFVRLQRVEEPDADAGDAVREVVFHLADPVTSYIRYQQDRVDLAPVPGGALEEALAEYGSSGGRRGTGVHTGAQPTLVFLGFDVATPPWDDVDVRRAVSLAIDRDALSAAVSEGNLWPADAIAPPGVPGRRAGTCTTCRRDVEEAAAIFADHGVGTVTLTIEENAGDAALVRQLTDDLGEAGVTLHTRPLPFPRFLEELGAGTVGLYQSGWMTEVPEILGAVAPLVESGPPRPGVSANYGGYADEEVDALLARARVTQDPDLRAGLVNGAEEIALGRDQALVPLYTTRARLVVSDRIRGFVSSPYPGADLSDVRIASTGA